MKKSAGIEFELPFWERNKLVAGVDEVGRGCLAGPVVSAAVILPSNVRQDIGIRDSKLISSNERDELDEYVRSVALSLQITFIDNTIVDEINIRRAALKAMQESVDNLHVRPEYVLVDGNFFEHDDLPFSTIVKGDSRSISIAAASIIAKVARDRWMKDIAHKEYPLYNFDKHKGYATKSHTESIIRYGVCPLHRMTFLRKLKEKHKIL